MVSSVTETPYMSEQQPTTSAFSVSNRPSPRSFMNAISRSTSAMTSGPMPSPGSKRSFAMEGYPSRSRGLLAGGAGIGKLAEEDRGRSTEDRRSEEHTSELQSHSFISYAVFC